MCRAVCSRNNSEYETSDSFQPKHVVYLKTATVTEAKLINGKTAGPFVFAINRRNKHPIYLKAQDQREMTSWISAMVVRARHRRRRLGL